jgi:alanyl-tRNA synthetase
MTSAEIRQSFLDFFKSKGHQVVPSSPVVLPSDPTLLFANAGMNQFKEIFLGARQSSYKRVADTQKCIRVSGKHNDLEEVGIDTYHHTFFEMLGNWSFGDYYKAEAISWAWELMTKVWKLPKERLWATVYREDDEAIEIWKKVTDINPAHILKFDEKDNFWEMGETGPCGPCSEIHIDRTANGCGPELINAGTPDAIELWNLVFIQYNRRADGTLEELPAKHVDTGMGFERVVSVLQGKKSNYDTDVFMPLLDKLVAMSGAKYEGDAAVAMRVISDHLRALSFAIADGVIPSNEGRGYVLRRLLRRAARYGRKIGLTKPFMKELFPVLESVMSGAFPELKKHGDEVMRAINAEEESFAATLDRGIELFEEVAADVRRRGGQEFPGDQAFKLYDTYGFPVDLTRLMAAEKGLRTGEGEFDRLMAEQRKRARDARKVTAIGRESDLISELVAQGMKSQFVGYAGTEAEATTLALFRNGAKASELKAGEEGDVMLDVTPFYAEAGGQVGDIGLLSNPDGEFEVLDTQKPAEGLIMHRVRVKKGTLAEGARVRAAVDFARRSHTMRHHTSTHLLNAALHEFVGPQVRQAGSYVSPERLRFDFTWFEAVPAESLARIEQRVNEWILQNHQVQTYEMPLKDVPGSGIVAVFDEKYGDMVRVVDVNGVSRELCGGTHVRATGDIGSFRIVSESSVASGVRRIEAVCGWAAYEWTRHEHELVRSLSQRLSVAPEEIGERLETLIENNKKLEKDRKQQSAAAALGKVDDLLKAKKDVAGVSLIAADVGDFDMDALRSLIQTVSEKLPSGVVVLGSRNEGKACFIASVSDDLVKRGVHAGKLIGQVAKIAGGGGGGQPNKAQAGGKDASKVAEAISKVEGILKQMPAK